MKKIFLVIIAFLFLKSCVSVKKHNQQLETPIAAEKLKQDVDFAYLKLQKLHPRLYWYISKESLDYKFDSLKFTITKPLKPYEFYLKLQPVVSAIKEGHLRVVAPEKRLTKKEIKRLKNQKGLLSRFNYVLIDGHFYIKDNPEKVGKLTPGTEIIKINDEPIANLLNQYRPLLTSDGFNTTYYRHALARRFSSLYTLDKGIMDSIKLETKFDDSLKTIVLRKEAKTESDKNIEKQEKKRTQEKKIKDYNPATKSFNRNLQFLAKDSSIALVKIKSFSGTYSKRFYKETFSTLKKADTKYLIIDIRDNLGGSLSEINNLYSYVAPEKFKFIKEIEIANRTAVLHSNYFSNFPVYLKPLALVAYPSYLLTMMANMYKKEGKYYIKRRYLISKPKKGAFKGKIYVLINGSSFSASSILSAKLKGDKRAVLVGEETGGANDGTVAGIYSTQKLPHSKLKMPVGLFLIQPEITLTNTLKGVTPNIEVIPNLNQIINKKNIELDWVLKDIENEKSPKAIKDSEGLVKYKE